MGHRDHYEPGDMMARISFPRRLGTGPDAGKVTPYIELTDETSGRVLRVELTNDQLVEMLSGGGASVSAEQVTGFRGLDKWGQYLHTTQRLVPVKSGDYGKAPADLPHVAAAVAQMEADGWQADSPRRNNAGQWVIIGRRFTSQPE